MGPVKISAKREILWQLEATQKGYSSIIFQVNGEKIEKSFAVGDGFMRISAERPGWQWTNVMLYPAEKPFASDSLVQSIRIDYPERTSSTGGTNHWLIYFFIASMIFALIFKPFLKVRI